MTFHTSSAVQFAPLSMYFHSNKCYRTEQQKVPLRMINVIQTCMCARLMHSNSWIYLLIFLKYNSVDPNANGHFVLGWISETVTWVQPVSIRECVMQPASQAFSQSVSQSISQTISQSGSHSISQPVSQQASQSVCQSASKPVSQSASQPASQSASQSVSQRASQSASQSIS
jgi:hypothetical protein